MYDSPAAVAAAAVVDDAWGGEVGAETGGRMVDGVLQYG